MAISITQKAELLVIADVTWCSKGVLLESCFPLKYQWELHNSFALYRNIWRFLLYFKRLLTDFTAALSHAILALVLALLNCECKGQPPLRR